MDGCLGMAVLSSDGFGMGRFILPHRLSALQWNNDIYSTYGQNPLRCLDTNVSVANQLKSLASESS